MQEMMQSPDPSSSSVFSVLVRQRAGLQWHPSFPTMDDDVNFTFDSLFSPPNSALSLQDEEYPLHELGNDWPNLPNSSLLGCSAFPRHQSLDSPSASSSKGSKKRKAETPPKLVGNSAEKDKRIKVVTEAKANEQSKGETKPENLKENGAASPQPPPKQDFIHVRARRGQATDSHSLAERVRRERIGERMKYLQGLVPGCDKITGKAGMLDEIINYVQALQRQVEFLSMKLAAVNPWIDFNLDSFFLKEVNMAGSPIIPAAGAPPQMVDPSYLGLNPMRQMPPCDGLNMNLNSSDAPLLRPYFNVHNSSWDANSQSISCADFNQGKGPIFPLRSGCLVPNDLKVEM